MAYYSGYQEWGTDVLIGWTEDSSLQKFLSETWNGLWDWIKDQEFGNQVEKQIDRVKDTASQ